MYDKNVAIIGCTIEKTTKYDLFREDKIRMKLYQIIMKLYKEKYRIFICHMNTNIGLLAADMIMMLREANKCPDIYLSIILPGTVYPRGANKLYCALYDDLLKQANTQDMFSEKDFLEKALGYDYIVCYYDNLSTEIKQIRASNIPFTNIWQMI